MKLTILFSKDNPSDYHRLLLPARHLKETRTDLEIKLVDHRKCAEDVSVFECDVLFLSRLFMYDWKVMGQLKEKYGFKTVVDFDDYYRLTPEQLRYKMWQEHNIEQRMTDAARNADLLFVTGEPLYKAYREFNKNIMIIPNSLPFSNESRVRNDDLDDRLRFIYVAGKSHYNDLKMLRGLLQKIYSDSQFQNEGNFTFCGYDGTPGAVKMEYLCKGLARYYTRENLRPLDNYMDHYKNGDVALAPLEDNLYNNAKSNLKFIEAASKRLPLICSEVLPYTQDRALKNKGIIYCKNTSDWYRAFKFFLNNRAAVEDFGEACYQWASEHYNLTHTNRLRTEAFQMFAPISL